MQFKNSTDFMEGVSSVGIFILTKTLVTFRVQNPLKIVIMHQIMTCLLVISYRIALSKLTYYPIQTPISTQIRPRVLNRAMRTKRESLDPAELIDKTKI